MKLARHRPDGPGARRLRPARPGSPSRCGRPASSTTTRILRESGPGDVRHVYRNPDANWASYSKVLLEPVTIWRSGRKSLEPVPKEDLLRLVEDFQGAVRARLGRDFRFVDARDPACCASGSPSPTRTPRIRCSTSSPPREARVVPTPPAPARSTPRPDASWKSAVIEGDIRDAKTNVLLAAGVESRRPGAPPFRTWAEVDQAFAFWADRLSTRLEAAGAR